MNARCPLVPVLAYLISSRFFFSTANSSTMSVPPSKSNLNSTCLASSRITRALSESPELIVCWSRHLSAHVWTSCNLQPALVMQSRNKMLARLVDHNLSPLRVVECYGRHQLAGDLARRARSVCSGSAHTKEWTIIDGHALC